MKCKDCGYEWKQRKKSKLKRKTCPSCNYQWFEEIDDVMNYP